MPPTPKYDAEKIQEGIMLQITTRQQISPKI